jgi:hypothetical protein
VTLLLIQYNAIYQLTHSSLPKTIHRSDGGSDDIDNNKKPGGTKGSGGGGGGGGAIAAGGGVTLYSEGNHRIHSGMARVEVNNETAFFKQLNESFCMQDNLKQHEQGVSEQVYCVSTYIHSYIFT